MRAVTRFSAVLLILGMFAVSGCARALEPAGSPGASIPVFSPPPGPQTEATPAPPGPGHVWAQGHHTWTGERWTWVPGRWQPAKEGHSWVNPRYEERDGRGYYILGGWVKKTGEKQPDGTYSAGAPDPDSKVSPAM